MIMKKVKMGKIIDKINGIKRGNKQVASNFYQYSGVNLESMCYEIAGERSIVFVRDINNVARAYFCSTDLNELTDILKHLSPGIALDYITKNPEEDLSFLTNGNFRHYAMLKRLHNPCLSDLFNKGNKYDATLATIEKEKYCNYAKIQEAKEIYEHLNQVINPIISHLCDFEELKKLIENNWVVLYKEKYEIIAIEVYYIIGKKWHNFQLVNSGPSYVSHLVYKKCLVDVTASGINYGYCWVDTKNERALRYHSSRNFVPDGLWDIILLKD